MKKKYFLAVLIALLCLSPGWSREKTKENEKKEKLKADGIVLHTSGCRGVGKLPGDSPEIFHYVVKTNGEIKALKPCDEVLPHLGGGFDKRSLSVLVERRGIAGVSGIQMASLQRLLFVLMKRYDIPLSQIERHFDRDIAVYCPGFDFPYFELMYSMSKRMIKDGGYPVLEDICRQKGIGIPLEDAKLVVEKSKYTMSLYKGDVFLKSYSIGLSNRPFGDKLRKGDRKTPLGEYYICEKNPMRAWMEINYPNERSANLGRRENVIGKYQYEKIVEYARAGGLPWHDSDMGNDVGLHAGGFTYGRMRKDYTAGCVGLEDPEAYEIFFAVPVGSKVIINE